MTTRSTKINHDWPISDVDTRPNNIKFVWIEINRQVGYHIIGGFMLETYLQLINCKIDQIEKLALELPEDQSAIIITALMKLKSAIETIKLSEDRKMG